MYELFIILLHGGQITLGVINGIACAITQKPHWGIFIIGVIMMLLAFEIARESNWFEDLNKKDE